MLSRMKRDLLFILLLGFSLTASSEDIDLFTGVKPTNDSNVPNVLFILDNTANWNNAFVNEMNALRTVVDSLRVVQKDAQGNDLLDAQGNKIVIDKFRFGIMMFTESGGGNGSPDGAYVRSGLRLIDENTKPKFIDLINSFHKLNDKSNGGKLGVTMAEAYYYFSGDEAYAGHNKIKRDYAGNISGAAASNAIYALPGNAFASASDTQYADPVDSACQKNIIIYISNGPVQDNTSDIKTANSQLTALGGNTAEISLSPSGSQSIPADEWARFMATAAPTKIRTYTVDVDPLKTGQGPGFTKLLESMANYGKGKYFAVDSSNNNGSEIVEAIQEILSEIQGVNSVFASASLPVSVNTQGTYLNQIFIGMFRPDLNASPRWNGNLKQFQFKASTDGKELLLNLVDADENLAINKDKGFITQCARSFWTPDKTSPDTYWSFKPEGNCLAVMNSDISNTPDGDVVEKGASGYHLRAISPDSRIVKTCDPAGCSSLTNFNTSNSAITQSLLNATNSTERVDIINWARGMDVKDENKNTITTEMRPSAHGDVVHSRPVAIDYGGSTGVVVYYGGSDGFLHAVNGNQTSSIGSYPAGAELWTFIAPEHYGKLKRLYDNSPVIKFPSVNDGTQKPYFFDGPVTAYKDNTSTWIYAAQRRGGRMVYAFDVTSPTSPVLKWSQGCPNQNDDVGCTSASFAEIGQSWSAVKPFKSSGYESGGTPLPMVIMGGGYDTCEDVDLNTCTDTLKGNKVYVMDANSGALLKTFTTDRSVVGDITIVPNVITGLADYAYAADTGGNIYRITMGSELPINWTLTKIAALGCDTATCPGGVANRKFLFAPEVVITPSFNAILVGSGDREHPLLEHTSTASVDNAFFMVKDAPRDADWWLTEGAICGQALACKNSLMPINPETDYVPSEAELANKKGWYLDFGLDDVNHDKEQVVTSAVVALGTVTFSTHTPKELEEGSCGPNLGEARVYNLGFLNGSASSGSRYGIITGGGLPPSPVAGMVTVQNPKGDGTITVPFVIGSKSDSPLEGSSPQPAATTASVKTRAYWYLQQ